MSTGPANSAVQALRTPKYPVPFPSAQYPETTTGLVMRQFPNLTA